jgi:hypothetical protein
MCGIVLLECEYRVCDAARLRWEVEGVGRGERSKTLLPPGRSWALRAVLGTVHADAERRQIITLLTAHGRPTFCRRR